VVAPPALRRVGWPAAATLAAVALGLLALIGSRPDSALVRFRPAGVMRMAPHQVTEVNVTSGSRVWRFMRDPHGEWTGGVSGGATVSEGVRLLHASAPDRTLVHEELGETSLAELGLAPPRYVVTVAAAGRPPLRVRFGGLNALGVSQYAQVEGHDDVVLLPRYVGEAWERATGMR